MTKTIKLPARGIREGDTLLHPVEGRSPVESIEAGMPHLGRESIVANFGPWGIYLWADELVTVRRA